MCGLPRSGKSTWIKKNKGNSIVVSNDWIRENILGTTYMGAANPAIWMITDATIRILLSQGKNVILDGCNHTHFIRKFFTDLAKEYGANIRIVCVDTPRNTCLIRNQENKKLPDLVLHKMSDESEGAIGQETEWWETV